jgi:hypothetical protein
MDDGAVLRAWFEPAFSWLADPLGHQVILGPADRRLLLLGGIESEDSFSNTDVLDRHQVDILGEIGAPDAEVVDLVAIVGANVRDLVLAASHPDHAPGPEAAGLALDGLDSVPVSRVDRQVVPGRPKGNEHGVSGFRQGRENDGFCACSDIAAIHVPILPDMAPVES